MRLILSREDLLPCFKGIHFGKIELCHFKPSVRLGILAVGGGEFCEVVSHINEVYFYDYRGIKYEGEDDVNY
jgi:hypothetical protein